MATTSNTTLLYFEASGGIAKWGKSGQSNQLQTFVGTGNSYSHWSGAIRLPRVHTSGSASQNATASGAIKLPKLRASGICGALGAVTLPSVTASGTATNPDLGRGALVLPKLKVSGHALAGYLAHGNITLPRVTATGLTGARGYITLPHVLASGTAKVETHASGAVRLPSVRAAGSGTLYSQSWRAAITLPSLRVCARAFGAILLPRITVSGSATNGSVVVRRSWAMNVQNNAVTEFPAYFFVRFMRWNNRHYGIGANGGLYLLEGDNDAGVAIPWAWETGVEDFGSPAQKGVKGLYFSGYFAPGMDVTLVTDRNERRVYSTLAPTTPDRRVYRVVTGKGVRTSVIGVGASSTKGGYFECERVAPKYDISGRNI